MPPDANPNPTPDPNPNPGPNPAGGTAWLAFDSDRDGSRGIYLVRSDGAGLFRLTNSSAMEIEPAFFADGGKLAYTSNASGSFQVYTLDFATKVRTQVTHRPYGAHQPGVSRDGSLIAFTGLPADYNPDAGVGMNPPPGIADLFIIHPDGAGEKSVMGAMHPEPGLYPTYYPASPAFGPDPQSVVYASNSSIRAIGIDGQGDREIAGVVTEGTETPSVSPDGTQVAFASWDVQGEAIRFTSYTGDSRDPAHDGLSTVVARGQTDRSVARRPAWGPIGLIAFETGSFGQHASIMVAAEKGGPTTLLTNDNFDNRNPSWAPAGFQPPK
jgi:Tol biopolymer transport system component